MRRILHQAVAAALPLVFAPLAAHGVIFYSTGDPTHNTAAPSGSLDGSGWQWEIGWRGGFLLTPIAPHYFITAGHIDPACALGVPFSVNEVPFQTVAFSDGTRSKDYGDLRLYHTDSTFYSFAPVYNAATDGSELLRDPAVVIGRGTQRGSAIVANGEGKGWNWGPTDGVERWGQNRVAGFRNSAGSNDQLTLNFDANDGVSDEVHVSTGDSGGGIFLNVNGQWKVAGIISSLQQYRLTQSGSNITAALYDTGGLYGSTGLAIPESANNLPSAWYANRVSTALATFMPWLDLSPTWNTNGSGDWASAGNWTSNTVPSGIGVNADFRTAITSNVTVTLSTPRTVGSINFDDKSRYTLAGSPITLDVASGSSTVMVASGNHTIASRLILNDATMFRVVDWNSVLTVSGGVSADGKAVTKEGDGTVELPNIRGGALTLNKGVVKILPNGTSAGTSKITSLTILNGSKLNLGNNDLIIDYAKGDPTPLGTYNGSTYTGITHHLVTAYNSGTFNQGGLDVTTANDGMNTLGIAEASDVLQLADGQTAIWSGQTVDSTSVLIKYTYAGDANLDGQVNIDDYVRIDFGSSIDTGGYSNGDFNFDGSIDVDDYTMIDYLLDKQGPRLTPSELPDASSLGSEIAGQIAAVPEPSSLSILAAGAIAALRRRRRTRTP